MKLVVDFERPPDADLEDIAQFAIDALSCWGGQLHPEDPMFNSLRDRIRYVKVYGRKFLVERDAAS